MLRTAIIAAIATCFGGAASPLGSHLFGTPVAPAVATAFVAQAAPRPGVETKTHHLRLDRAEDGLFHAPVWINGRRTSMIVDTGATVTVLTARDAARLGIDQSKSAEIATLRTAAGVSRMRWATVRTLRLAGRDVFDLDVAIVEHGLDHSLLGQDVLGAGGVLRVEGDAMEIS